MGGEQKLTGPDLSEGVALDDLADGKLLTGHAGGEAVLLARRGDDVFAVGATCTHYSGPLGEGLLVDDTVRCPWHHACFDLRTGAPLRAPALNPIACYDVTIEDGRVRVGARKPEAKAPASPPKAPARVVIVGAGAAGHAAAETLRREGYRGELVMIGADSAPPVDRPNLSKDYLAGNAPEDWLPLRPTEFFAEHNITLLLGARVTSIDTGRKQVVLDDGRTESYDKLLLATGAEPVKLDLPGGTLPHVHYLRTLADCRAIIAAAASARRAVVIGSSFIGLEVAASLRARKIEVDIVSPDDVPLGKVMGPELGAFIRRVHEEHGVKFHLGTRPKSIDAQSVTLENGERLSADLVVIGVGVRPAVSLAEKAGLKTDRGVLVNEYLETSSPGVFAAGDIARWPDPHSGERIRVEHWVVAERQGQTAARNLLGRREKFDAVPFFWSAHYDVGINYVGHASKWDRLEIEGSFDDHNAAVCYIAGGRPVALATIYRDQQSLQFERTLETG
ncbi:MAG TPA: FAD-dependent oxidoreductase [Gammaproteobacteria bacterium]|nr:FAD-dependent oxidoreductase [Gammaproteobacteria bacterium]